MTYILSKSQMIDEFTDVNKGEKELMKLWNHFAMQSRYELPSIKFNVTSVQNLSKFDYMCITML